MNASIELQVISRLLDDKNPLPQNEVEELCRYGVEYYDVFREQIEFILNHKTRHGKIPDTFTYLVEFSEQHPLDGVTEPTSYLVEGLRKNRKRIMFRNMYEKLAELAGNSDIEPIWEYVGVQVEEVAQLAESSPRMVYKEAVERGSNVLRMAEQSRIPTGFKEIDSCMYGGWSTVEELAIIFARTNSGKSWMITKMADAAQKAGFPVLIYSPEMMGDYLSTRIDTWSKGFLNSQLMQGKYTDDYWDYLRNSNQQEVDIHIVENEDIPTGEVTVPELKSLVIKYGIKLLLIDGLSYMTDARSKNAPTQQVYKNIAKDLFQLSKRYGCAVVVAMQANRETKDSKDAKGEIFPTIMNIEGSDEPARIATTVFAMRQLFEQKIMDIRIEKIRTSAHMRQVFSYAIDFNTGKMENIVNPGDSGAPTTPTPSVPTPVSPIFGGFNPGNVIDVPFVDATTAISTIDNDDDVEF